MTEVVDETAEKPYVTLYNKYRPHKFSELIGQDQNANALRQAVKTGRTTHGYLFSGPRGTGKTTSARILAAALNCPTSTDGEPCGECDICVSTFNGTFSGTVNELNATDQRGIDDVRQLLSSVEMAVASKYKVYIIDEVHQLTKEASSLLLKTLEEPPSNSIRFILATTDPDKLLDTIRSRLTHIQFRLLNPDDLGGLIRNVIDTEGIEADEQAILNTVAAGRGSARDALSALERTAMGLSNENMGMIDDLLDAILAENLGTVLVKIAQADLEGELNSRNVAEDILSFWRDTLVYQQAPKLVLTTPARLEIIKEASKLSRKQIIRNFETTANMLYTMRTSGSNRIALEGGIARLLTPIPSTKRLDEIMDVLEDLKKQVSRGVPVASGSAPSAEIDPEESPWNEGEEAPEVGDWLKYSEEEAAVLERQKSGTRRRRGTGRKSRARDQEDDAPEEETTEDTEAETASESEPEDTAPEPETEDQEDEQNERPRRRRRAGTPRRRSGTKRRRSSEKDEEDDDTDEQYEDTETEPDAPEETEPETAETDQVDSTPEEDQLFEQAVDAVTARTKALIQEGSYATNDGIFTIYTERRVTERSQERITDALGVEVAFEVRE